MEDKDEKSAPNDEERRPRGVLSRLTINEYLTLFVGIGSLVVSYMAYRNSADTSDIKSAVSGLAELAAQTKRQADGQAEQLRILKAQADQASLQTLAISGQTEAIKSSTVAAIGSAKAQMRSADLATSTQRPRVTLSNFMVDGFDSEPDKYGNVKLSIQYTFNNVGGSTLVLKAFDINLLVDEYLPKTKPKSDIALVNNSVVVEPGKVFQNTETGSVYYHKSIIDSYKSGKSKLFAFGRVDYSDMMGTVHTYCYAYELRIKPGTPAIYITAGGPEYHCDT